MVIQRAEHLVGWRDKTKVAAPRVDGEESSKVACLAPKKVVIVDAQLAEQMVSYMAIETAVYLDDSLDKYSAPDLDLP